MNELENQLRELPRSRPSADLDTRMERLFAAATAVERPRSTWWWGFAAGLGCAAVFAIALYVVASSRVAEPTVVRRVTAGDPMSRLIDQSRHAKPTSVRIVVRVVQP